jgi:hypothetical protein
MPSHPDRVRRSYHESTIIEHGNPMRNEQIITIIITKMEMASCMTKRAVKTWILSKIMKGIDTQYHA